MLNIKIDTLSENDYKINIKPIDLTAKVYEI